jgi:O-antigen ligase
VTESGSVTSEAPSSDLAPAVGLPSDRRVAATGAVAVSVVVLGAAGGASSVGSWPWAIAGFTLLAASLFVIDEVRSNLRGARLFVGAFLALSVWTGLSALWSIDSSASLRELERDALYLAAFVAAFGLLRFGGALAVSGGVALGATVLAGYSLADFAAGRDRTFINPSVPSAPIGYANALATLSLLGAIASVSLAATASSLRRRLAWLSLLAVLCPTMALTKSLGAMLAAGVAVGAAVILWAGPILRSRIHRALLIAAVLAAGSVIGAGAFLGRSHLTRNDRVAYWQVAANDFKSHPVVGSGAGSYSAYWTRHPERAHLVPLEAHSLYLETGAELGAAGLALVLATLLLPLGVIRPRDPIRVGAACAYLAFVMHAAVDWDWEIPVVTASALYFAAVLLGDQGAGYKSQSGTR